MQELGKNAFSFEVLILFYIGHKKFYLSDYKLFAASNQLLAFETKGLFTWRWGTPGR